MATLAEVVKRQRQGGRGVIGSLTSAIGQKTLEAIDPRRMLNQKGLLTSLFPSLKAYQAKGSAERMSRASDDLSSSTAPMLQEMNMKLDIVGDNTRLTAKNTMMMPSMARDMNVMRQNVIKLVKLQGGKASTRADGFFLRSFERERATESELQAAKARRLTSTAPTPEKKDDGGPGILGMLGGALGLSTVIGTLSKAITSIPSLILSGLSSIPSLIVRALSSLPSLILQGLSSITDLLKNGIKIGFDVAKGIPSVVGPGLKSAGASILNIIRSAAGFLMSGPGLAVLGVGGVTALLAYLLANAEYGDSKTGSTTEDEGFGDPTKRVETDLDEIQKQLDIERARQRAESATDPGYIPPNATPSPAPTPAPASSSSTKPVPKKSITSGEDGKLLDFIASKESNGDYNMVYGQGSNPNLTNMTIAEVLEYQKQLIAKGQKSSAVGRYQFIRTSLEEEAKAAGINIEKEKFTPEIQDKLILHRLRRIRGLDDFRSGKITPQQFAENLSKEFASLPSPIKGGGEKSYYEGTAGNKALTNMESVYAAISPTPSTSGTQVAAATSAVSDSQSMQMQQPVVLNAPTTNNVSQGQGGGQISGIMADTLDKELASLLVDRMVGA